MSTTTPRRVTAIYNRDTDGTWLVHLAEEERCHTFGRTFTKARTMIRDAAALWYDTDPVDLEVDDQLAGDHQAALDRLRQLRDETEARQAELRAATADVVRDLQGLDLTERDIAALVGLSHQRVHQIAAR